MDFYQVLDQVLDLLRTRKRVTYRALKRQFDLDDEFLEDLKEELIYGQRLAVEEESRVLVWTGDGPSASPAVTGQDRTPLSYMPPHLTDKILAVRLGLEGERKYVSVLFADLKGSMELLADRDPEEARRLLDAVLKRMMEAVHYYEGTVNQVLGDGIMALFGAPIAYEDHAVRACYAALRMQASVHRFAEEAQRTQGIPVQIRVGLNSGEVVLRTIDSDLHMDYTAVGQTTHLAARMEQIARPGSILATSATLALAEGYVQVRALGPIPVKGLSEPVAVYEVTGEGLLRSRLQIIAARGLTRFVGRDTELAQLRHLLERVEEGHGQVMGVVEEAGVGKSRLFMECLQSHRTRGWLVLESNAVSYGKATSYQPVIDLLKHYFQIADRDTTQNIQEKVTGKILTLDPQLQERIPALLFLLEAMSDNNPLKPLEPPYRKSLVLAAIKHVLVRESQRQPLLLVFEDLHWVDDESQQVLDTLVESLPTSRILLLTNYRPEYQERWGAKTYYTRLRIDPLPPQDADDFLEMLLGDACSLRPLKQLLKERTGGNPFFLEESVCVLVETQALTGRTGAYELVHSFDALQMPATIQALLAARIDRLPPAEKQLLQAAAVIGTDVPLMLLHAIADQPDDAVRRGLAHLQSAEFLYESRLFPDPGYTFKHALTHEVAYSGLLHERRRQLHQRVGLAIETGYPDRVSELAEMLANQFERGEDWPKAVHYLLRITEKVKGQHSYERAAKVGRHALEITTKVSELVDERVRGGVLLGDVWSLLGDIEQANQYYTQALRKVTEPTARAQIAKRLHRPHTTVRHGATIAYYEHGSGEQTLVLVHPVMYGLAVFQPVVEKLCQEFRIITIDPRGRGASDALPGLGHIKVDTFGKKFFHTLLAMN